METQDSAKTKSKRSDDSMTNKRMKTDPTDDQLLEFSTSNNHYSSVRKVLTDTIDKIHRSCTIQTAVPQKYTNIVKSYKSCLETLPNELFFHIFSYMNQTDIVQTFFNLNRRFNSLTFESVRRFQILAEVPFTQYLKYLVKIENAIEMISLDVKLVPDVFCNYIYPNLRSIILKQQSRFTVKLNVEHCFGLGTAISCLNLLRMFSTWTTNEFEITPLFGIDCIKRDSNTRMNFFSNTLPCSAIVNLSVHVWCTQDWIYLCGRAPNLTYLQIIYEDSETRLDDFYPPINTTLICGPTHLTNLHIVFGSHPVSFASIEWLISHCQSTLQQFTFCSYDFVQINGKNLEKLLRPCRQLTKLAFIIELKNKKINMTDALCQFQTDWWLDPCRPPIFLHHNSNNIIYIVTMPCTTHKSITLEIDSNTWLLNKERLDSSLIYFSKVPSVNIINNSQQPVTLDLLRLIDHMFHSSYYYLNFTFWGFHQPKKLYDQFCDKPLMIPQLRRVSHLRMTFTDCHGLDAISLIIWLLVASNVKELDIALMPNDDKYQLAKDLEKILQADRHIKLVLNRIERLVIFSSHNKNVDSKKTELFFLFLELFPEAVIDHL